MGGEGITDIRMSLQADDQATNTPRAVPRGRLRGIVVATLAVVFVGVVVGFVGFLTQLRGVEVAPASRADGIVVLTGGSSRV